jgi:xylulokinase
VLIVVHNIGGESEKILVAGKYILTIDLGTSGPKVALVSPNGEVLAVETEKISTRLLSGGGAEQSPSDWWKGIKSATHKVLGKKLVPIDDILAISCTGQWSGTVAVDRRGQPLMDAIIWMDTRGAKYVQELIKGIPHIQGYALWKIFYWIRLTGGIPGKAGKDAIAHILYIKNEHPEIYQNTYKFLEPKDYLNFLLSGKYSAGYDSICLHWLTDNRFLDKVIYNRQLLKIASIDLQKLPELHQACDILGPIQPEIARELGLNDKVKVIVGAPDVQSAAIGSGAVEDYQTHLYIGTSSWLACHLPFKMTDLVRNMASLPSAIPDKYLLIAEQECAGICLTHLRDNIFFPDDELASSHQTTDVLDSFNKIAARIPAGSDKLIFTPWLYGERAPVEDACLRGGFFNQSLNTTRGHFVRSVFEGVALNTRWLLESIENSLKRRIDPITITGGGAKSEFWCQIYADVLGRTIQQIKEPLLVNIRGAAFLASLALHQLTLSDIPNKVEIANRFHPNPQNHQIYNELFREFINIYKQMKPIYHRLNRSL